MYILHIMNTNQSQEQEITLSLLGKEYDTLLIQYQNAYQNYIDYLTNNSTKEYSVLPERTFWGSNSINEGHMNSIEECQSQCSSISNCTGATFNSNKQYCWVRNGEGDVMPGLNTDTAIIPKKKQYSAILNNLNIQLIAVNQKMMDIINNSNTTLQKERNQSTDLNQQLMINYNNLTIEKDRIFKLIQDYENVEEINKNSYISVNQKYSIYITNIIIFIIIVIIIVIFRVWLV